MDDSPLTDDEFAALKQAGYVPAGGGKVGDVIKLRFRRDGVTEARVRSEWRAIIAALPNLKTELARLQAESEGRRVELLRLADAHRAEWARAERAEAEVTRLKTIYDELLAQGHETMLRLLGVERERDEARAILSEIARATAEQGFLFMGVNGRDDWPAAVAWIKKHISLTPDDSAREQFQEIINDWRAYAGTYQADNAALLDVLAAFVQAYDDQAWPIENDIGLFVDARAALVASHPGAPLRRLVDAARAWKAALDTTDGIAAAEQAVLAALEDV